jgi:sporulation protein YlmC with PRC-barrel domain
MADITKITPNTLINAERVEGTSVYNPQGDKLGTIDDIMIDKVSGKAIYAIMSFAASSASARSTTRFPGRP